ncbi:MAG: hypothetical protein U0X93_09795 [Anaerolineales bacterium]
MSINFFASTCSCLKNWDIGVVKAEAAGTRPSHVAMRNATIAQIPKVSVAVPVIMSKKALMISAGATCIEKRKMPTASRSIKSSQGRKRIISQITFHAGSEGVLSSCWVRVVSVILKTFYHEGHEGH